MSSIKDKAVESAKNRALDSQTARKAKKMAETAKGIKEDGLSTYAANNTKAGRAISDIKTNGLNIRGRASKRLNRRLVHAQNKVMNSKIVKKTQKTAQFVVKNWKITLVVFGIASTIATTGPAVVAATQSFGQSPHYYCDLNASKEEKQTAIYRQYCGGAGVLQEVDENGIPIVPHLQQCGGDTTSGYLNPETKKYESSWAQTPWPGQSHPMGCCSCGPTSTCSVLSYITGELYFPSSPEIYDAMGAYGSGYGEGGTSFGLNVAIAKAVDVEAETKYGYSLEKLDEELDNGNFVQLCVGGTANESIPTGKWTDGGHYIMVIGRLPDGTYAVEEGARRTNSYWGEDYVFNDKKNSVDGSALDPGVMSINDAYNVFYTPEGMKG